MNNLPSSPLSPSSLSPSSLSRRQLLRNGGIVLSMGAILAACGSNRGGSTDPGRLGVAAPTPTLPEVEIDDLVLLRTAQSLAHTNVAVYAELLQLDVLSSSELALMTRCSENHVAQSGVLSTLIGAAGGEPFACPNPFLLDRAVEPAIAAIEGSDDVHRDVLNIAHGFEALNAASYQAMVPMFTEVTLRSTATAGIDLAGRQAAAIALTANADNWYSPAVLGKPAVNDDAGFPVLYAIPSIFGRLNGIDLIVGARNEEGTRFSTQLQTPADNSFVYEYQSC